MKLYLDKLKNGDIHKVKVELPKFNIKKLARRVGVLSEYVKMFMFLPNAKIYYALNDRTINLLMKGNIDMSATTGDDDGGGGGNYVSDAEAVETVHK